MLAVRNQGYAYTSTIGPQHQGQRLLSHLAALYPHTSAAQWQQRLQQGELSLDGRPAEGTEVLRPGQTLVWQRPAWWEEATPQHFTVLWEDEHLLAVDKPRGLPTVPGGGFLENTLLRLVQKEHPESNPVHRLGRATTGIVLFAKNSLAAARLAAQWNSSAVEKIYQALAQGVASEDDYNIQTRIGLVQHPRLGGVWAADPGGKAARSQAKVLRRGAEQTNFAVCLHSGRPHQIRIHLASIGHPLTGDPLYGPAGLPLAQNPGLPGDGGYYLHAQFLRFRHPASGEAIALEAALPPDFPQP